MKFVLLGHSRTGHVAPFETFEDGQECVTALQKKTLGTGLQTPSRLGNKIRAKLINEIQIKVEHRVYDGSPYI